MNEKNIYNQKVSTVRKYANTLNKSVLNNVNVELKEKYESINNNSKQYDLYMTKDNFLRIILQKKKINEIFKIKYIGEGSNGLFLFPNGYKEVKVFMDNEGVSVRNDRINFGIIPLKDISLITDEQYILKKEKNITYFLQQDRNKEEKYRKNLKNEENRNKIIREKTTEELKQIGEYLRSNIEIITNAVSYTPLNANGTAQRELNLMDININIFKFCIQIFKNIQNLQKLQRGKSFYSD